VMTKVMRTLILRLIAIVIVIRNIHLALASETLGTCDYRDYFHTTHDRPREFYNSIISRVSLMTYGIRLATISDYVPEFIFASHSKASGNSWVFCSVCGLGFISIHHRLELLGITLAGIFMRFLCTNKEDISTLRPSESISEKDLADIATVHLVVQQAGWLTWDEYCYLIVAGTHSAIAGGAPALRFMEEISTAIVADSGISNSRQLYYISTNLTHDADDFYSMNHKLSRD
jgi:hypothetical protein